MSYLYRSASTLLLAVFLLPLAAASDAAISDGAKPSAARVYQLAPADTTMICVMDGSALFATDIIHALLAHPAFARGKRLLDSLAQDTGFMPVRDLSAIYIFSKHDRFSTGVMIAEGRFDVKKLETYLVRKRKAQRLSATSPGESPCYRFLVRGIELYAAFPARGQVIVTGAEKKLREQLYLIATRNNQLTREHAAWFEEENSSISMFPINLFFKDLGAFVGGLQPFALVEKSQTIAQEKSGQIISVFAGEFQNATGAEQFVKLITVIRQLITGYCTSNGKTHTTELLESIELQNDANTAYIRAKTATGSVINALNEFSK